MSDDQDALRLALRLEILDTNEQDHQAAAAALRRLHALVEENSILQRRQRDEIAQLKAELAEQARLNGMGSEREARLRTLNAELVEALKHAAECVQSNYLPDGMGHDWDDVIAKAEASNG